MFDFIGAPFVVRVVVRVQLGVLSLCSLGTAPGANSRRVRLFLAVVVEQCRFEDAPVE